MNLNFYLLGNPGGFTTQIPSDGSSPDIKSFVETLKDRRLCVLRTKGRVMNYVYLERLNDRRYIGFRFSINDMQVTRFRDLMDFLHSLVEMLLVTGDLITVKDDGLLGYASGVTSFTDERETQRQLKAFLTFTLEYNQADLGVETLKGHPEQSETLYYEAVQSNQTIEAATYRSTSVVIDDDRSETTPIRKRLLDLKKKIGSLTCTVNHQQSELATLRRQKKQFKVVLLLMLALLGAAVYLVTLRGELGDTTRTLHHTEDVLARTEFSLDSAVTRINVLKETLRGNRDSYTNLRSYAQGLNRYDFYSPWRSQNHSDNTVNSYSYSFSCSQGDELSFEYYVDGEGPDRLTMELSGPGGYLRSDSYGGQNISGTKTYTLPESGTYYLYVSYRKDGSISHYSDHGAISGVRIKRSNSSAMNRYKPMSNTWDDARSAPAAEAANVVAEEAAPAEAAK